MGKFDGRMDGFDGQQDTIVRKLVDIDARLDTMVTRDEFDRRMTEVGVTLDAHTVILKRLDEEMSVTHFRLDRLEVGR
jgi:hypothetical protein